MGYYNMFDAPRNMSDEERQAWADAKNKEYEEEQQRRLEEEKTRKKKFITRVACGVIAVIVVICFVSALTIIPEGKVGVKYRFGQIVETGMPAGLHFVTPILDSVSKVDITEQVYVMDVSAYTKDTQTIESLDCQVNYFYDKSQIDVLVRQIGLKNIEPKLISPNMTSILKNEVGKYKAEELIANRSSLETNIQKSLSDMMGQYGIIISRVSIQDIEFKASFEQIVEEKVAAEQQALKVQNETVKKEEEAKQAVIAAEAEAEAIKLKAQAEAEANRLINASLTPTLVEYEKIQKWNGEFPGVMGNTVNPFVTIGE